MDPQSPISQSPIAKHKLDKKYLLIPLLILIVAALVLMGWHVHKSNPTSSSQPAKYAYNSLTGYTTPALPAGQKMTFQKPVELTQDTSTAGQVTLIHLLSSTTRQALFVSAGTSQLSTPLSSSQISDLSQVLATPGNPYYQAATNAALQFVKARAPTGTNISIANAQSFSNANIKTAWQFPITISDPSNKKLQGKEVYALGSKAYYFFMVVTPDYNWQSNQKVWDQMFASLKIDQ